MGWKSIKEHYKIEHIVQVANRSEYKEPCILIGSGYVCDIIVIRISDAKVIKQYKNGKYNDGWSTNEDLKRYNESIIEDEQNGTLRQLIELPDTFDRNIPVYTIQKGLVIRSMCEELGYPDVTHSGQLMYDSTHFSTREEAYKYLLKDTSICKFELRQLRHNISEAFNKIGLTLKYLCKSIWYFAKARTIGRYYTGGKHEMR